MVLMTVAQTLRNVGLIPYRLSPLVFGIGLSKTGTTSLGVALQQLGFRHKSYDAELLEKWHFSKVDEVLAGMEAYSSFEDFPYPLMYDVLMRRYGRSARYVLTVRKSPEIWLESLKAHALRAHPERSRYRKMAYGFEYPHQNEKAHIEFYNDHIRSVKAASVAHNVSDLLIQVCWEQHDGWPELCALVDMAEPGVRFPHANRQKDTSGLPYKKINAERIANLTAAEIKKADI